MRIEVAKVPPEGGWYEEDVPASVLELEGDQRIRLDAPIHCRFLVRKVSRRLIVEGRLDLPLALECSRCAAFFSTTVTDLSFVRTYYVPEGVEYVDVTEDVREDVLLLLPPFPLCSAECKGLCPRCGHRLNEGPCSCPPAEREPGPWDILNEWKE